ncbi:MAG TPA: glycosyltransferase family 39 protein, partial [Tepidisphaeraceae bacterium]|nr:glycosyltransferase family 39 protein [Tepidisphaeraceae bacterium]
MISANRSKPAAVVICAAMLILFAILSYSAVLKKSATYDEPLHTVGGFTQRVLGDFRLDADNPALFGYWASLPLRRDAMKLDLQSSYWKNTPLNAKANHWQFAVDTLYHTPGNDADSIINKSRFMFLIIGVALGIVIALWSWQLGGAVVAIIAAGLYSLDPNFIGHASLVKNDVVLTFLFTGAAFATWRFGRKGSWPALAAMALSCAAALNVKFSGVILPPIVALLLLGRAMLPLPWTVMRFHLTTRPKRVIAAAIVSAALAATGYLSIWAC